MRRSAEEIKKEIAYKAESLFSQKGYALHLWKRFVKLQSEVKEVFIITLKVKKNYFYL